MNTQLGLQTPDGVTFWQLTRRQITQRQLSHPSAVTLSHRHFLIRQSTQIEVEVLNAGCVGGEQGGEYLHNICILI